MKPKTEIPQPTDVRRAVDALVARTQGRVTDMQDEQPVASKTLNPVFNGRRRRPAQVLGLSATVIATAAGCSWLGGDEGSGPDQPLSATSSATPSATPSATESPRPTPSPTETENPVTNQVGVEYKLPTRMVEGVEVVDGESIAGERGGDAEKWKEIKYTISRDVAVINNGQVDTRAVPMNVSEWVYTGDMSDLNENYQIPQTQQEAADKLGGNVRAEDINLFMLYEKGDSRYDASWMDKWTDVGVKPGPDGMVIGFELVQHGRENGDIDQFRINLPKGWLIEYYYDNGTQGYEMDSTSGNAGDDYAATIWNATDSAIKVTASGGSVWPWGNGPKVQSEQKPYNSAFEVPDGFVIPNTNIGIKVAIPVGVGTNMNNGGESAYLYELDQETGLATKIGIRFVYIHPTTGELASYTIDFVPDEPYPHASN